MAEQKILISININDNASDPLKKLGKDYSKLNEEQLKQLKTQRQISLQNREIVAGIDQEIIATNKKASATKKARTQAGLNNAIILETGRLASDASYGFTAMANNLSQLTSLFGSFAETNGGVIKSFKQLGKSLMGTGGVLLLVQLFIAALQSERVAEFARSLMGMSKAAKLVADSFSKANDEFGKQLGFLKTMETLLNDTNVSQKQKAVILKRVSKEHKDLNVELDEEGKLTEESTHQIDLYVQALEKKAKSQALLNTIQQEYVKLTKLEQSSANDNIGVMDVLRDKVGRFFKLQNANLTSTELIAKGEEKRKEAIEDSNKVISDLTEKLKELGVYDPNDTKGGAGARERDFKQQLLNLDKLEESFRQKSIDRTLLTEDEKIDLEEKFAKAELDIRLKQFKDKQKLRLDEFLESKASDSEKQQAKKDYLESIELAEKEHGDVLIQQKAAFETERSKLERERAIRASEQQSKAFKEEQKLVDEFNLARLEAQEGYLKSYTDSEIDRVEAARLVEQERFDAEIERLEILKKIRIANGESAIDIDQKITNATKLNSEAKIALAEQEKEAKIAIANQVGNAIVAIAGEGSSVGKAASVAMAIMNTREAFTAALGAKPYGPWNIAQSAAVLAMGFKQVKDIMAVKIPGKEPASGGLGGGNIIQAPDFNVVGASQTSQLAQTVAGEQAKPVKAFVVGKDISTQQELDRNITNTASFG